MNIDINVSEFRNALNFVNGIDGKSTLPILNNVLIKAEGNRINLMATDLVIGKSIELQSEQEGLELSTTIPLKKALNIFKSLEVEYAVLKDKKEQIEIVAGKSRFKLNTLPADEYPSIAMEGEENRFNVSGNELKRILSVIQHAMGKDDVRVYLNGVCLEGKDGKLRAVATDGHRLAIAETACDWVGNIIIPRIGVTELIKSLTDDSDVSIAVTEFHAKVFLDNSQIVLTLIEGKFPDYQRVIPVESKYTVRIVNSQLLASINRVVILAHKNTHGIRLTINPDRLVVDSGSVDGEEGEEEIIAESNCDDLLVGVNAHYLIDVLNKIDSRDCVIEFQDADRSLVIKDGSNTFVVMPMRI